MDSWTHHYLNSNVSFLLRSSTDNIDLWVGGLMEKRVEGAKLGPTFMCLVVDQFKRLRELLGLTAIEEEC